MAEPTLGKGRQVAPLPTGPSTLNAAAAPQPLEPHTVIPGVSGPHPSPTPRPWAWPTWLVSDHLEHTGLALVPDRLQGHRSGGVMEGTQRGLLVERCDTYHVWVGLVGQPQCLQVELLFQLVLPGVQEHQLLPDFPAARPKGLILRVLGTAQRGQSKAWLGPLNWTFILAGQASRVDLCCLFFWSSNLNFLSGNLWPPHDRFLGTRLRPGQLGPCVALASLTGSVTGI